MLDIRTDAVADRLFVTDEQGAEWLVRFNGRDDTHIESRENGIGVPRKLVSVSVSWDMRDGLPRDYRDRTPADHVRFEGRFPFPRYEHVRYWPHELGSYDVKSEHKMRALERAHALLLAVLDTDEGRTARLQGEAIRAASAAQELRKDAGRLRELAAVLDAEADRAEAGQPYASSPLEDGRTVSVRRDLDERRGR